MATGDEAVPGVAQELTTENDPLFNFTLDELWAALARRTDGAIFYARMNVSGQQDTYVLRGHGGVSDQYGLAVMASYHLQRQMEAMVNPLHEPD